MLEDDEGISNHQQNTPFKQVTHFHLVWDSRFRIFANPVLCISLQPFEPTRAANYQAFLEGLPQSIQMRELQQDCRSKKSSETPRPTCVCPLLWNSLKVSKTDGSPILRVCITDILEDHFTDLLGPTIYALCLHRRSFRNGNLLWSPIDGR